VITITGFEESLRANNLNVYPNPVKGVLHLSIDNKVNQVQLMTLTGKVVLSVLGVSSLDLSMLKAGQYILRISTDQQLITKKIIKQ
jgi:hypothetical protein